MLLCGVPLPLPSIIPKASSPVTHLYTRPQLICSKERKNLLHTFFFLSTRDQVLENCCFSRCTKISWSRPHGTEFSNHATQKAFCFSRSPKLQKVSKTVLISLRFRLSRHLLRQSQYTAGNKYLFRNKMFSAGNIAPGFRGN